MSAENPAPIATIGASPRASHMHSPGEFDLIARLRGRTTATDRVALGIGDDCASIRFTPGAEVLVTTDMLMDGRHFLLDRHPVSAIGREVAWA